MEVYEMSILNDIRQKLLSGSTPSQLIKEGYKKSSVSHEARKLKKTQTPGTSTSPVDDELQELRHQKEVVKLRKEITDLENAGENLPRRVTDLEKAIPELRSFVTKVVEAALWQSLVSAGVNREEAKEFSDGWVDRHIKWEGGR
jgi:hypothetical protein